MYRRIAELDKNLRNFTSAVGQLGSSAALRLAADDFRCLLEDLLCLFRRNVSELFGDIDEHKDSPIFEGGQHRFRTSPSDQKPAHDCFALLADGLNLFLLCLDRFRAEFTDEVINVTVESFHRDLQY